MINGIQDVYLNVEDMARAIAFYETVLGCRVTYSDSHWTSLDAHGLKVGLHWMEGEAVPEIPHDLHGPHAGATLTFHSTDITEDKAMLMKYQVEILNEINADFGHLVIFKDSEGNFLKLMKPKY